MQQPNIIRRSLQVKLIIAVILVPTLFSAILGAIRIFDERSTAIEQMERSRERVLTELAHGLADPLWNFDVEQAKTLVKLKLNGHYFMGIEITEIETGFQVFNLYRFEGGISEEASDELSSFEAEVMDIQKNNKPFWKAKCYFSDKYLQQQISRTLKYTLSINVVLTALLTILMILALNILVTNPIRKISDVLKHIADGDFSSRIDIKQKDEIGKIGNEVNSLLEQLESSIHEVILAMEGMAKGDFSKKMVRPAAGDLEKLKNHTNNSIDILAERTRQLKKVQQELIDKAHQAGMADIASGTLHNVGNILNSVKVSAQVINNELKRSSVNNFKQANDLLREHQDSMEDFILNDPKGKKLLEYYLKLESVFMNERDTYQANIDRLIDKIEIIADVIMAQQNYAGISSLTEEYYLDNIIDDALTLQSGSIERFGIQVVKKIEETPRVPIQKAKLVHILINLIKNAKEAMVESPSDNRKLTISLDHREQVVYLAIQDTGKGIDPSSLKKIFTHGYTTKKNGHGFGLHSCANYMAEMKGNIRAESEGIDKGSTFILEFELDNETASIES